MKRTPADGRSPTSGLLLGLILILTVVVAYSWYITAQISGLRALQTNLADRSRKDSLQLLRIQNDLHSLGLAMRDMLDDDQPYPLTAWTSQFRRIRLDLDDALKRQGLVPGRTADEREYLGSSVAQFWSAIDRMFAVAREGDEARARADIRLSLQARQASLSTAVARLLVRNNESEEQTSGQTQHIYAQVQRQVYWFVAATMIAIVATSFYLVRTNRRLFAEMASLSQQRRELAQTLIAARESTLHQISRELHDEFGQILTALGSMLGRAEHDAPEGSVLRSELRGIGEMAQTALGGVRSLSQALHPAILDQAGLEAAIESHVSTVQRQLDMAVSYERAGPAIAVDGTTSIHVYRVMQEALSNAARHSGSAEARVRLRFDDGVLALEVEDRGCGIDANMSRRGLGIVAMRERAELVGGTLEFLRPAGGGTLVRLRVPLENEEPRDQ